MYSSDPTQQRRARPQSPDNSAPSAWFMVEPKSPPRGPGWGPGMLRAWEIGFEDALRALENGSVGIGRMQCELILILPINLVLIISRSSPAARQKGEPSQLRRVCKSASPYVFSGTIKDGTRPPLVVVVQSILRQSRFPAIRPTSIQPSLQCLRLWDGSASSRVFPYKWAEAVGVVPSAPILHPPYFFWSRYGSWSKPETADLVLSMPQSKVEVRRHQTLWSMPSTWQRPGLRIRHAHSTKGQGSQVCCGRRRASNQSRKPRRYPAEIANWRAP